MASAQIQQLYRTTAASATTTTTKTTYTTHSKKENYQQRPKQTTTATTTTNTTLSTFALSHTEFHQTKTTTTTTTFIESNPEIYTQDRKQFTKCSSTKTDCSRQNDYLTTSNKSAEFVHSSVTASSPQATPDTVSQHKVSSATDSESVKATVTASAASTRFQIGKIFPSTTSSTTYNTHSRKWSDEQRETGGEMSPRRGDGQQQQLHHGHGQGAAAAAAAASVDAADSASAIVDNKTLEGRRKAGDKVQQHEMLAIVTALAAGVAANTVKHVFDNSRKRERTASAINTAVIKEGRGEEEEAGGGEGGGETVSVNINIASNYCSDLWAGQNSRNKIFTGIYKEAVVVVVVADDDDDEKSSAKQTAENICNCCNAATATISTPKATTKTKPATGCRNVCANNELQQTEATCNIVCKNALQFHRTEQQRYQHPEQQQHQQYQQQQPQQQAQQCPKRIQQYQQKRYSDFTFSNKLTRKTTRNSVATNALQHVAALLLYIFQSIKQRNYNNHNSNNNNKRHFVTKKLPTTFLAGEKGAVDALSAGLFNSLVDCQQLISALLSILIIFNLLPLFNAECDQTFVSRIGGPQNGTFSAPLLHNPKSYSRQCLYTFLAGPGQRVEVVFTSFSLRGSPPDGSAVGELPACVHEYMDIYSEVQSSEPAELINSPFGGRYCGTIPPRRRISMYRAIAISFFSNKNVSTPDLFEGRYRFLNASEYEIGIPIAGSPCSYTITPSMSVNKTGILISPTYPGAYPKDISCTYQFLGESNQRVRLEFRDFDLFFGGPHCPFDYVKVYDGPDNSSALIGTYCGQQRNLVLYSSESSLFVHFYTLPRTANTQNRGFKGIYEFSESFVKLDFIRENDGIHIRGSECDQKILSRKESTGVVLSPNYPYPYIPKTVCRYFIYGMQDAQHLERVRLEFMAFNIPKVDNKDKSETNCSDGYLKIYLKGQETADAYDKFDYELCGNETQRVVSDGPRLAMVFSSGELQGRGFKGKYTFETEYKIPGTAAPDSTCSFTYVSSSKKRGDLNSPRYPSNYPSSTNCSYLFLPEPNEQVTIVFDHFKVKAAGNKNATAGAYGSGACFEDWLEMYLIYRDNNDRFLGRYCNQTAPGPVESPRGAVGLRITLHTDQENVASGFKARYFFEATKSEVGDCGGNFSNQDSGIITSPNYPAPYKAPGKGVASMACNWMMTARPGYKLSINFEHFSIEGDPASRGCPAAVLRIWVNADSDQPPLELCGDKPPIEQWHYISTGQTARISFTTSDKTVGAPGFRIVWTEIQDSGPGPPSIGLLCESTYLFQCDSGYCISDKLRCDGVKNCGPGDDSDELHCIMEAPEEDHGVLIIITLVVVSFLICLLCTLYHSKRKRRHHPRPLGGLHRSAPHYDSTMSATGLSSSRRHLQAGGSISGSLHGINSGTLIVPPAPLPPTSVPPPPHICIVGADIDGAAGIGSGMLLNVVGDDVILDDIGDNDDDDDDDDDEDDEDDNNNNINNERDVEDDDDANNEHLGQHQHHLHPHHHLHHHHHDIFINDIPFDETNIEHLNHLANV